jgi:hypothetical protein
MIVKWKCNSPEGINSRISIDGAECAVVERTRRPTEYAARKLNVPGVRLYVGAGLGLSRLWKRISADSDVKINARGKMVIEECDLYNLLEHLWKP